MNKSYSSIEPSETGLYIIRLIDPSLATYRGEIAEFSPIPFIKGKRKLDVNSPASQKYLTYLNDKQNNFITKMENKLSRSVQVRFQYLGVLNALAVEISQAEAEMLFHLPEVLSIHPDQIMQLATDVGPLHIGANTIWTGETITGLNSQGEGIIIGIIDSGINSQHVSFASTDEAGYTHLNPYGGTYHGWCVKNPSFCNNKLIGAYNFYNPTYSPEDNDGHGSHTASTAAGNRHTANFSIGSDYYSIQIQGVAPHANIVAYKVCSPYCPSSSSIAAINSAILNDQVDVLNFSITGVDSPWSDSVDRAFLEANAAGIFVAAAAGNDGPDSGTVTKTGPWNATVGASTHNRIIANSISVNAPETPLDLQNLAAVPGEQTNILSDLTGLIRYDAANQDGCTTFPAGTFTGSFALIQRGTCEFSVKVTNAVAAGANGVIIFNNVVGPPITMGEFTGTPPAFMIDLKSGDALRDFILVNPVTTSIVVEKSTSILYDDAWADIIAGFSSRGPSQFELVKPDFVAPGVNILAAVAADSGLPNQYGLLQGTSMAAPHATGAAALLIGIHPDWSPAAIKSALTTSADHETLLIENAIDPATPYDQGSGLLNLTNAARTGLVLDETYENYVSANPAIGGDPKTLNQPGIVNYACQGTCNWSRTVTNTLNTTTNYSAFVSTLPGMILTVSPTNFSIDPGEDLELLISADVSTLPAYTLAFGKIHLVTEDYYLPDQIYNPTKESIKISNLHLAVVVIPEPSGPVISVNPEAISSEFSVGSVDTSTLSISNEGVLDLMWNIEEANLSTTTTYNHFLINKFLLVNEKNLLSINPITRLFIQEIPDEEYKFETIVLNKSLQNDTKGVCDLPEDIPWMSANPLSGAIAPDGSAEVTITFNTIGLALGEYKGNLCINSNDISQPLVIVPVALTVSDNATSDSFLFLPVIMK